MTECYRCGQEGHTRAHCPQDAPLPPAAPDSARAAAARPPLRLVRESADPERAHTWAQFIRDTLGFGPPEERTRD